MANTLDSKTIDELQELGKITGTEMTIVSQDANQTKKVSIDTIIGYAASILSGVNVAHMALSRGGTSIEIIPEGEEIPVEQRVPGHFYLEITNQTSIRTKVNVPTSVIVSSTLGLKRV